MAFRTSTCEVPKKAASLSLTEELVLLLYTKSRALQAPPLMALGKGKAIRKMRLDLLEGLNRLQFYFYF